MKWAPTKTHRKILNMKIVGLRWFGIWSLQPSASSYSKFSYYVYNKCIFMIILIFIGTLVADLIINYKNLQIITDDGCYLAGISVIAFKLYIFHNQHKRISNLVEAIHEPVDILDKSTDLGVTSAVKRCMIYENISTKGFLILGSVLAIALIFFIPKEEGVLPIRAAYPFDISSSPMYEVAFSIQALSITYGLLTIVLMDEMVTTLIRWLNVQLSILANNYEKCQQDTIEYKSYNTHRIIQRTGSRKNLNTVEKNNGTPIIRSFIPFKEQESEELNNSFTWKFNTCIKNHQRFIEIIDELNDIFGSSMLLQLFASFTMICLTAFQAVLSVGGNKNLMKFVIYLSAACSQLTNWCWFGNELLYHSASLYTSQWLCGWENESHLHVKPLMIISLMRTKRPLQLRAGKFYNMSLQTLISILRNSYSFFTLLSQITADT